MFKVGDIIKPKYVRTKDPKWSEGVVTEINYIISTGVRYRITKGSFRSGWDQESSLTLISTEQPYDPTQMGDKEDDI